MKLLRLAPGMLRYRVAFLLLPFLLLGPAVHGELAAFRWSYLAGLLALLACYVVATCLNDVSDVEIDRVNQPNRPLVTGEATRRHLLVLAAVAAVIAVLLGILVGPVGVGVIALSLMVNVAYSVPPVRLSMRPHAAAPVLALAYVALPYALGLAAAGVAPALFDTRVAACFVVLFTGRMLLKDFRDRRGDAAFGKRTFLLAHGKAATLLAVLACVVTGDGLLLTVLPANGLLIAATQTYFAAIGLELYRLSRADHPDGERVAIARGARMGNAVVLTWLGLAVLEAAGATPVELGVFVLLVAGMYWFAFLLPAPAAASSATTA